MFVFGTSSLKEGFSKPLLECFSFWTCPLQECFFKTLLEWVFWTWSFKEGFYL